MAVRLGREASVSPVSGSMPAVVTVAQVHTALLEAWGSDTCTPGFAGEWRTENPAREQCGVTALVVQDVLGGDLMLGEVRVGGVRVGVHYWNRLADGQEVDLTASQFTPQEAVVGGRVVVRPATGPRLMRDEYERLRGRVLEALGAQA